jgi:hypothetical protein
MVEQSENWKKKKQERRKIVQDTSNTENDYWLAA